MIRGFAGRSTGADLIDITRADASRAGQTKPGVDLLDIASAAARWPAVRRIVMKVLILNGSPRPKGHTKQMIGAFCEGLEAAGNEWDVMDVCKMNIRGCLDCEYCHTKGKGACIQKDEMQDVYAALAEAEMLVLASPIYYHGLSGQLKCAIDRFYAAAYPDKPEKLAKVAMFLSSGDPEMYEGALFSYQGDFLDYLKLEGMGVFTTHGGDPDVPQEKLEELRAFGAGLK